MKERKKEKNIFVKFKKGEYSNLNINDEMNFFYLFI